MRNINQQKSKTFLAFSSNFIEKIFKIKKTCQKKQHCFIRDGYTLTNLLVCLNDLAIALLLTTKSLSIMHILNSRNRLTEFPQNSVLYNLENVVTFKILINRLNLLSLKAPCFKRKILIMFIK